jgi:hypothetical protein
MPTLSRFACSDWFMGLSGYGCCAFGGAKIQHSLPVGLNGGRIIPELSAWDRAGAGVEVGVNGKVRENQLNH